MLQCDWDHPRVCGEHLAVRTLRQNSPGSSPRMRGTHGIPGRCRSDDGIIPAYAGNTQVHMAGRVPLWDHPRVCGEHNMSRAGLAVNQGSSPRMRGTLDQCTPQRQNHGIIPAYAGNTGASSVSDSSRKDHPRVCGEHGLGRPQWRVNVGSSPRMRGTLCDQGQHGRLYGIIPAYAGNTLTLSY